jgi:hypothetical protein
MRHVCCVLLLLAVVIVFVGAWPAQAAQVLSELADSVGEPGVRPDMDIVRARVLQVDQDLLQFEMEVRGDIPRDPDILNHFTTYMWFLDTDKNPATGQPRGSVGSEYNVLACWRENFLFGRGSVEVIPGSAPAPFACCTAPMFVGGNVVRVLVRRDQIGGASSFRWRCAVFSWSGIWDDIEQPGEVTLLPDFHPPGVPARVTVDGYQCLRDGLTAISVHPRVYDGTGQRLSLSGRSITLCTSRDLLTTSGHFMYAQPGKVGLTTVTALVDGVLSSNECCVLVGSLLLRPSMIYLDTLTQTTSQTSLQARDAGGTPVPLSGHSFQWQNDLPDVASVSPEGVVQALPTGEGRYTCLRVWFDDAWIGNWCVVRVVKGGVLTPQPSEYGGRWVSFWLPGSVSCVPDGTTLDQMMQRWDVLNATDVAYRAMYRLLRVLPYFGDRQGLAAVHEDSVYRICGGSGNPVGMGFDPVLPSTCIQCTISYGPAFGLMVHEMGHGFVGSSDILFRSLCNLPGSSINGAYGEGLASLLGMYSVSRIVYGPRHYGVAQAMVDALLDPARGCGSLPSFHHEYVEGDLAAYVSNGSHYEDINPSVLDGILMVLAEEYGWEIYPRFFSAFLPPEEPLPLGFLPESESDRATLLVTALSVAAGEDLRPRFRDEWGFPIDDVLYGTLYPELERRIGDRAYEHYQRFDDVPDTDSAVRHIAAIADAGIAGGSSASPPLFSPWASVTRAQMAKFLCLAAGKEPLDSATPTFADVPKTNWAYGYIERLADAASWGGSPPTSGCRMWGTSKYFCPFEPVTREQMAKFLCIAAGKLPMPSCSGTFADVASASWACPWIERLADPASWGGTPVTSGCACPSGYPPGARCYCLKDNVTRGQMAVFLVRAFGIPL